MKLLDTTGGNTKLKKSAAFSQYLPDIPEDLSEEDAKKVFAILGGGLDEMSGAGGGAVGGYSLPLGAKPRHPKVVGSEKKKKRKEDDFLKEEIVSEVANYLLGISVG